MTIVKSGVLLAEAEMRIDLKDPNFSRAVIVFDPVKDKYFIAFTSSDLLQHYTPLSSQRSNERFFSSIDSANKVLIDLDMDNISIDNRLELFK